MSPSVKLLSRPNNFAVVQLPDRQFPGVVVQGDTLNAIIGDLELSLTSSEGPELIDDLIETLDDARDAYEAVCSKEGISLPYNKPSSGEADVQKQVVVGQKYAVDGFEFILPDDFDEYAWEVEAKGWFSDAEIVLNGMRHSVNFYDPARLRQDVVSELAGAVSYTQRNLVVVEAVTRANMERAAEKLAKSDFFK
ncbi:hypothetical protein ABLO27_22190 [Roseibium sp. SCPC15]|uniref:DUF6959 family protein n=1 Tax=Roseibium sp. SCP15 TaxID=3141376 RepID=UPI00333A6CC1